MKKTAHKILKPVSSLIMGLTAGATLLFGISLFGQSNPLPERTTPEDARFVIDGRETKLDDLDAVWCEETNTLYLSAPEGPAEAYHNRDTESQSTFFREARVDRVIDVDTILVTKTDSGIQERVRLIGVDAPETGEPGASEATEFVRSLVSGRTVWLEADGSDRDRFGRLRRYVWLRVPTDPECDNEIRELMLNALLLVYGHAEAMTVGTPRVEVLFRELCGGR